MSNKLPSDDVPDFHVGETLIKKNNELEKLKELNEHKIEIDPKLQCLTVEDVMKALDNGPPPPRIENYNPFIGKNPLSLFNWGLKPGVLENATREFEITNRFDDTFDTTEPVDVTMDFEWISPEAIEKVLKEAEFAFSKFEGFPDQKIPDFKFPNLEKEPLKGHFEVNQEGPLGQVVHTEIFDENLIITNGEELIITYEESKQGIKNVSAQIVDIPIIVGDEDEVCSD